MTLNFWSSCLHLPSASLEVCSTEIQTSVSETQGIRSVTAQSQACHLPGPKEKGRRQKPVSGLWLSPWITAWFTATGLPQPPSRKQLVFALYHGFLFYFAVFTIMCYMDMASMCRTNWTEILVLVFNHTVGQKIIRDALNPFRLLAVTLTDSQNFKVGPYCWRQHLLWSYNLKEWV